VAVFSPLWLDRGEKNKTKKTHVPHGLRIIFAGPTKHFLMSCDIYK
jgi:hypothetical protein